MPIIIDRVIVFVLISLVVGCAPSLKTSNEDLLKTNKGEGLVIGSLQIKLMDQYGDKASKWWVSVENTKWHFVVNNIETSALTKFFKPGTFELTTIAGGEETPFIAKLPAGIYRFEDMYSNGFAAKRGYAGKYFKVDEGQITYIGRLVAVMPKYPGNWLWADYMVESALSEILPQLHAKYSNLEGSIKTNLMRIDNSLPDLRYYDKDPSIIRVLLMLYKRMGLNTFVIFDHWGHDRQAIGITSPHNHGVLVYISTFGIPDNYYNVRLELPPTRDSILPYTEAGKRDGLDFEELVDVIRKHLDGVKVSL